MSLLTIARAVSEFLSMWVACLMMVAILISGPFALRELRQNWTALRGQFGIAFCLMAFGIAMFLFTRWVYLQSAEDGPPTFWDVLRPITMTSLLVIAAGALIAIRAMTVQSHRCEWVWLAAACAAVAGFLSWLF